MIKINDKWKRFFCDLCRLWVGDSGLMMDFVIV